MDKHCVLFAFLLVALGLHRLGFLHATVCLLRLRAYGARVLRGFWHLWRARGLGLSSARFEFFRSYLRDTPGQKNILAAEIHNAYICYDYNFEFLCICGYNIFAFVLLAEKCYCNWGFHIFVVIVPDVFYGMLQIACKARCNTGGLYGAPGIFCRILDSDRWYQLIFLENVIYPSRLASSIIRRTTSATLSPSRLASWASHLSWGSVKAMERRVFMFHPNSTPKTACQGAL